MLQAYMLPIFCFSLHFFRFKCFSPCTCQLHLEDLMVCDSLNSLLNQIAIQIILRSTAEVVLSTVLECEILMTEREEIQFISLPGLKLA